MMRATRARLLAALGIVWAVLVAWWFLAFGAPLLARFLEHVPSGPMP